MKNNMRVIEIKKIPKKDIAINPDYHMIPFSIGKEQKGLFQGRNLKIENRIIKTDCTLLDIFIYLYAMIIVMISTYGLIKLNVQLLFIISIVSLLGLYFLIRKNEKIMDDKLLNWKNNKSS